MTDSKYMRKGLTFACGKAIEEAGEFLAAMGKTQRWGWHSVNPELSPNQQETNEDWVRREIADLRGALDNLERELNDPRQEQIGAIIDGLRKRGARDELCEDAADLIQVFDFINSIEGAGYGGMAEFEIARETMRRAIAPPLEDRK